MTADPDRPPSTEQTGGSEFCAPDRPLGASSAWKAAPWELWVRDESAVGALRHSLPSNGPGGTRRRWRPDAEHATIAAACANYVLLGTLTMFASGRGPAGDLSRYVWWGWLAATALIAVLWFVHRMPQHGRGAVAFGVLADVGTSCCLLLMQSSADALIGAALFAVPGAFFTFYLSRRWLIWHALFSTAVIVALALVTALSGDRDVYATAVRAYLVITVVQLLPFTIHAMWGRVARQAQLAWTDDLTGVLNRRGLLGYVEHHLSDLRPGSVIACAVVDIDAFKRVNDTYGHAIGDLVIAHTAAALARSVDGAGAVARTGGEEFTIVLIDTPDTVGDALARVPTRLDGACVDLPTVTLSVGSATTPANTARPDLAWHTIARADLSMYAAKRAGGERMHEAEDNT